jgi:hypothetical protein
VEIYCIFLLYFYYYYYYYWKNNYRKSRKILIRMILTLTGSILNRGFFEDLWERSGKIQLEDVAISGASMKIRGGFGYSPINSSGSGTLEECSRKFPSKEIQLGKQRRFG